MYSTHGATFLAIISVCLGSLSQDRQLPLRASSSGISIPHLGFGTWNLSPSDHNASAAVSAAIQIGYRHIDCAAAYRNEPDVGKGIADGLKKAGLKREDIWVTSKLWNDRHEPSQVPKALDKTLLDLRLEYLDLYLMHWPVESTSKGSRIYFLPTWHAMIKLDTSKVRNIGISNFSPTQLSALIANSSVVPFAHQMEMHPYLPQSPWHLYHNSLGIHVTAYSPLGNSNPTYGPPEKNSPPALLRNDAVLNIAKTRGCTPAQVILAWGLGRGTSVIPKSSHVERIEENFGAQDCFLEYEDWKVLGDLWEQGARFNNPTEAWGVPLYDGLDV